MPPAVQTNSETDMSFELVCKMGTLARPRLSGKSANLQKLGHFKTSNWK